MWHARPTEDALTGMRLILQMARLRPKQGGGALQKRKGGPKTALPCSS